MAISKLVFIVVIVIIVIIIKEISSSLTSCAQMCLFDSTTPLRALHSHGLTPLLHAELLIFFFEEKLPKLTPNLMENLHRIIYVYNML